MPFEDGKLNPLISIVIPHRDPILGLFTTIASCTLAARSLPVEFVVCANGIPLTKEHERMQAPHITFIQRDGGIGPAAAREWGAQHARGDWLFFVDDHVVVPDMIFDRLVALGKDAMFAPATSLPGGPVFYHYIPCPRILTEMDAEISTSFKSIHPYPCCSAQNGQFMVRRSVWEKMNGYGGIFDGWNGEEVYFGMRAWMMGFSVWMHPVPICWHHSRTVPWKYRDEAMQSRFRKGLDTLKDLKAKHTLQQAYEMVMAL